MATYQKPAVVSPGYSPEPVEAGCCLRSCGGSPGGMQAGRHLNKEVATTLEVLETAVSQATNEAAEAGPSSDQEKTDQAEEQNR